MADDLGYGDLGGYGQTDIQTPNLDQMAQEGMRFTQFYSGATVCAPSRSVLMTGQHTGHTPIRGNRRPGGIGNAPLPDESRTIAEMLGDAGYTTGVFGKWGLGGPTSSGRPTNQGVDQFFGYLDQLRAHFYFPEFLYSSNGERVSLTGNEVEANPPIVGSGPPIERGTYSHDAIMDRALTFLDRNQDERFFLYLPVTIPHAALTVPPEAREPYLDEDGNSIFPEDPFPGAHYPEQSMPYATYAAMVSKMDQDIGRLLDKIQSAGLKENTIVLFTSDNGPHDAGGYDPSVLNSNGPLRDGKGTLYEGGIRVPMIAWGPGRIPAGTTSDHVSYLGDLMQTFAEIAQVDPPKPNDSVSFLPTLVGDGEQQKHDALYWEHYGGNPQQAVRLGKWKGVRSAINSGPVELYNLDRDLDESENVADQYPEVVEKIEKTMEEQHTPSDW